MNLNDAIDTLVHRKHLTNATYTQGELEAWASAFTDHPKQDILDAITGIANTGQHDIPITAVVTWLRLDHRRHQIDEQAKPAPRDPGCHCQPPQHGLPHGSICDMHRRIGLDAIATIRARKTTYNPPPQDAA